MSWFLPLVGFGGGVGGAILAGLATIGGYIIRALQFVYSQLIRLLRWVAENPEKGITLGAMLWVLAT